MRVPCRRLDCRSTTARDFAAATTSTRKCDVASSTAACRGTELNKEEDINCLRTPFWLLTRKSYSCISSLTCLLWIVSGDDFGHGRISHNMGNVEGRLSLFVDTQMVGTTEEKHTRTLRSETRGGADHLCNHRIGLYTRVQRDVDLPKDYCSQMRLTDY